MLGGSSPRPSQQQPKKQIYIAVKSNYSKWFVDQKTTREDGYYTPDEWLNIWIGIN